MSKSKSKEEGVDYTVQQGDCIREHCPEARSLLGKDFKHQKNSDIKE